MQQIHVLGLLQNEFPPPQHDWYSILADLFSKEFVDAGYNSMEDGLEAMSNGAKCETLTRANRILDAANSQYENLSTNGT